MATYNSPGVYLREIDESLYVKGAATSVTGFVGITERGPVGEPVLVTNWPQFVETFGGFTAGSWLPHAVKDYFDEGGSVLYVVRTVKYTAGVKTSAAATKTVNDSESATAWTVTATSDGVWGNDLRVVIGGAAGAYTLSITNAAGQVLWKAPYAVQDTLEDEYNFVSTVVAASGLVNITVGDGAPVVGTVTLTGGSNGTSGIADADYIGSASARTGLYALDTVDSIKIVAVPGVSTPAVHAALITYAENRGTVFAVLGAPAALDAATAIEYRTGTGDYVHSAFNSSYAGLYWPWIKKSDPITSQVISAPVEGHMAGIFARSDAETAVWYAPAGLNRAVLRNVLGTEIKSTQGERDELYSNQVNVIANFKNGGVVVWGQRTLTGKPSAFDRINVRRLLNFIKESLADTSRYLLFEPNDKRTWEAFKRFAEPFLANIQQNRGLYDFRITCDETTNTPARIDANEMVAKVFLKPTKTAEAFEGNLIVTGTGANFDDF